MPSTEYLEEVLERARAMMDPDDWKALQRLAIPRSGGRASWRAANLSRFEAVALRELRPSLLQQASDEELAHLWSKLNQWFKRARRRQDKTEPYERAASYVAQELRSRGKVNPSGPLMELAKSRATLAERLEELPDVVVLSSPAVALSHDDLELYVAASDRWQGEAVIDELAEVGVPAQMDMLAPSERAGEAADLYDLALVRSSRLEKSSDEPEYLTKAEASSGAMVALMAPDSVRDALDKAGLLKAEKDGLHITLLYLGKAEDLDAPTRERIAQQVTKVCQEHRQLKVQLTGLARFSPGKDGTPAVAVASAHGLSQLQADLERAVGQVIDLPSKYGWVPHLTLGYDVGELPDIEKVELPAWTAGAVRVQLAGDKLIDAPLEGREPAEKADWDLVENMLRYEPDEDKPWALYSRDGSKLLGRHATRAEAEAQERAVQVNKAVRIACSSPEKQVIYYWVSEPGTVDAHGHRISSESIERALHGYMANSREVKLDHSKTITGRAVIVEGYIAPMELTSFHGQKPPDGPIKRGSSIVGVHYTDSKLWAELKDVEHGISWGGYARKVSR